MEIQLKNRIIFIFTFSTFCDILYIVKRELIFKAVNLFDSGNSGELLDLNYEKVNYNDYLKGIALR